MAERTHISTSPACGQWETLLADALDGLLRTEDEATFSGHMASCKTCAALFEEARRGQQWLDFLSVEPEVPEGLLDKLLAQTGPGRQTPYGVVSVDNLIAATPGGIPLKDAGMPVLQKPGFMGWVKHFTEPRLMMTAAMAFFSIALTLNLTGVKLTQLRISDLKPSSIRSLVERRVTMASTPIVRYYDHLRLVYEVQSRMREMKRNSESENPQPRTPQTVPGESKQSAPGSKTKDGGSRMDPPQQSVSISDPDILEASLNMDSMSPVNELFTVSPISRDHRHAHSGGSIATQGKAKYERSTTWIAPIMAV
jgi:hypothetical protein